MRRENKTDATSEMKKDLKQELPTLPAPYLRLSNDIIYGCKTAHEDGFELSHG